MEGESAVDRKPVPVKKRPSRAAAKRKAPARTEEDAVKKKRSFNNFINFCNFVLAYEEQLAASNSQAASNAEHRNGAPGTNSAGESSNSSSPSLTSHTSTSSTSTEDSGSSGEGSPPHSPPPHTPPSPHSPHSPTDDIPTNEKLEYTADDESWNLVTCFCRRPFAGRPMIECSQCGTWVHLYCAKIKKDQVPDFYLCPKCRAVNSRKSRQHKGKEKES